MPWNIVLLLGGGFALASGSEVRAVNVHSVHALIFYGIIVKSAFFTFSEEKEKECKTFHHNAGDI